MTALVLTCAGRSVDDQLRPVGDPCGKTLTRPVRWITPTDLSWPPPTVPYTDGEYVAHARAAGWAVSPDGSATCPACRRPSREAVALARQQERGTP